MGAVLSRFAISKLAGWEISVNSFIEMAEPLGIDPTLFRISTGILISFVVIGYLVAAILSLLNKNLTNTSFTKWATYANLLGLLTMVGALASEFALRVQPKWLLVYIAIGIIALSAFNLFLLKNNKTNNN